MPLKKYKITVDFFTYEEIRIPYLQQLLTDFIESEENRLVDHIEIEEIAEENYAG